jgi:hypothetical protein
MINDGAYLKGMTFEVNVELCMAERLITVE